MDAVFHLTGQKTSQPQGDEMKKILTLVFTMLLAASLSFAQATGGTTKTTETQKTETPKTASGKKGKTKSHSKKGGKKGKKTSGGTTPQPPK
jgi:hypothetical protein